MRDFKIGTRQGCAVAALCCWLALLSSAGFCNCDAAPQLQVISNEAPARVFAGEERSVTVIIRNPGSESIETEVTTRLHQLTSATAVRLCDAPWKRLSVPPGQTVIESAKFTFPAVIAETHFLIQWVDSTNRVIGRTEVLVYPPDMLKGLKPIAGGEAIGVFDPQNQVKPLLRHVAVEFVDLADAGLEGFSGKLAIVGPFKPSEPPRDGLGQQIETLAAKGTAVVWIQPPPKPQGGLEPSFYTVTVGQSAVAVAQAELVEDLPVRPQSQLNLIHLTRVALNAEPPRLPFTKP